MPAAAVVQYARPGLAGWMLPVSMYLAYTAGVVFYLRDKHMYTHALWHGIVLAAAICHYVAVLLAM